MAATRPGVGRRLVALLLSSLGCAAAFVPIAPALQQPPAPTSIGAARVYDAEYAWRERWWPVAFERVTDKDKPHAFELLGTPITFWFNKAAKQWYTVEDTCPHRLAPLSEGRVDESGCIECPYHGWSFEGTKGTCTKLSQLEPDDKPPQTRSAAAVPAYPTAVGQGIIWVYPTSIEALNYTFPDTGTIPLCEPLLEPGIVCLDVSRDLPYSYETRTLVLCWDVAAVSVIVCVPRPRDANHTHLSESFLCPPLPQQHISIGEHTRSLPRPVHPPPHDRPARVRDARAAAADGGADGERVRRWMGTEYGHLADAAAQSQQGEADVECGRRALG